MTTSGFSGFCQPTLTDSTQMTQSRCVIPALADSTFTARSREASTKMFKFGMVTLLIMLSGLSQAQTKWRVLPDYKPKPHFWQKHPTRTKVVIVVGMGVIGAVVAIVQNHNGVCPNTPEYHDGTPPCPK